MCYSVVVARQLGTVLPSRYVARSCEARTSDGASQVAVEIRDVAERRLVTAIEVLSPTNKRGDGREEYRAKRHRILLSTAHLIEIDLLRAGERVPTPQLVRDLPYFVLLSRADQRPLSDVWPIRLSDRLPTVPVPLLQGDADVPLDLQQAFTSVYDAFRYEVTMDYTRPPEVPLRPDEAAWARQTLGIPRGRKDEWAVARCCLEARRVALLFTPTAPARRAVQRLLTNHTA